MKKLIHTLGMLILTTPAFAQHGGDDLYYAPVILSYMNGDFLAVVQAALPIKGKHDCIEKLQQLITSATEKGAVPSGGAVVGACLPIPPAPQAQTAT